MVDFSKEEPVKSRWHVRWVLVEFRSYEFVPSRFHVRLECIAFIHVIRDLVLMHFYLCILNSFVHFYFKIQDINLGLGPVTVGNKFCVNFFLQFG